MRIVGNMIVAAALGLAIAPTQLVTPAMAQPAVRAPGEAAPPPRRRVVPRITVVPLSRYHRECDFWLAVEHRPSGDVITPQQHCWWALR
jgi:hypothetical protein